MSVPTSHASSSSSHTSSSDTSPTVTRSPLLVELAIAAVHGWMRVYTHGMAPEWMDARRAEIDSDLWEFLHDPDAQPHPHRLGGLAPAAQILARLLLGMPDDLRWRFERAVIEDSLVLRRTIAMGAAAAILFVAFWILPAFFWSGRTEVHACANAAATPRSRAAYREQVIVCAGAFFMPRGQPRVVSNQP